MGRFSTAAKVAKEKEEHPERFCPIKGCLFRTFSERTNTHKPCIKHPKMLNWAARCECYKGHNSSSGRCNVRDVVNETHNEGDAVICERCQRECK